MTNNEQFEKGMVGLWDVQLTDMFPEQSTETLCLSYAIYKIMQDIKKYTERLFLTGNIENLPEEILDYLSIEKNTPYYDSDFSIVKKRELLNNGYTWNMMAGTIQGIESLIQIIFGTGKIQEWFDFEDEEKIPGQFDIKINNENVTEDSYVKFLRILRNAKNVSRHLRHVTVNYDATYNLTAISNFNLTDSIIIR